MKRLTATTIVLLVLAFSAGAQWRTSFHEADELKGTEEYTSSLYISETGDAFVCWSNEDGIKIVAGRGIFDYDDNYVLAIIGFYEDGRMVDKVTTRLFVPDGSADAAYSSEYRSPGLGKKIKEHLRTRGDVRILASKYSGADFDIRIPMNTDLQ